MFTLGWLCRNYRLTVFFHRILKTGSLQCACLFAECSGSESDIMPVAAAQLAKSKAGSSWTRIGNKYSSNSVHEWN
ncbi:hypothetical protein BDZ91DRAFT_745349 [Kalaharituber pfeilii]|nr:hypothetical protein BDZ91DRAFT_745349 [Kalaharituber pfeilii]